MASNDESTSGRRSGRREGERWYCHTCQEEIEPCLSEYTCSKCNGGFIEPISSDESSDSDQGRGQFMETSSTQLENPVVPVHQRPMRRGVRRTHIAVHRLSPGNPGQMQGFFQQLMSSLMGGMSGGEGGAPVNVHIAPLFLNAGDYVFTGNGLDNIITMLMNQLDNAGPPPAPKDQIDALPTIVIVQEQVDKNVQCHVCMEDFILDEKVRSLPCKHIYHGDCIIPWLELHGTCPICRKTIDITVPAAGAPPTDSMPTQPNDDIGTLD